MWQQQGRNKNIYCIVKKFRGKKTIVYFILLGYLFDKRGRGHCACVNEQYQSTTVCCIVILCNFLFHNE